MIERWDVVTIGNVSRNRYWREGDEKAVRSVICTSTLITGDGFRLLVDPSIADEAQMAAELDRRTAWFHGCCAALSLSAVAGAKARNPLPPCAPP